MSRPGPIGPGSQPMVGWTETGESNLLRIVDADGLRVMIAGAYDADPPDAAATAVEQIMDSVQIGP